MILNFIKINIFEILGNKTIYKPKNYKLIVFLVKTYSYKLN